MDRRPLYSDSDISRTPTKLYRRESVSEYLTSKRGSLSDLVFTTQSRFSKDSFLSNNIRRTRHLSLTNQTPPSTSCDLHARSSSLTTSGSLGSVRQSRLENRLQNYATGISGQEKRQLVKTSSLNSFLSQCNVDSQSKKTLKNPIFLRRKKWMKKIQSLQAFSGALKTSRNRNSPPVRKYSFIMIKKTRFITIYS